REGFIIIELRNIENAGNLRLKMERPALTGRDSDTVTVEVKNGDTFLNRSSPGSVEVGVSRNFALRGRGLDKLRLGGPGLVQSVRDTPRDVSASRLEGPLSEVDAILSQSPTDARVRLTFFQAAAKVSLEQKLRFEGGEPELNRTQGWPEVEVRAARPPPGLPRITVTLFGTGTGSVTSDPRTITCPGTCTGEFPTNTNVGMTAVARPGSRFKGWSPAVDTCSGATSPCTINNASTPRPSYALRAEFVKLFHLTVVKAGAGGTVTGGAEPNRIACGQVCGTDFTEPNASITLEAVGDSGNRFTGWSGACTGTGPCRVSMSGNDQRVTATFVDLSP
ncbi:MAG TPA: hypothetical protein VE129_16755, partial [Thermoanaerobaculia bacterium]|nr:hypothetical protein [Thermoanaerobaculia bacterium]